MLRREDFLSAVSIPVDGKELVGPYVAQQLAHFAGIEMSRRRIHSGSVIPQRGGDVGQGAAIECGAEQQRARIVTGLAALGVEQVPHPASRRS